MMTDSTTTTTDRGNMLCELLKTHKALACGHPFCESSMQNGTFNGAEGVSSDAVAEDISCKKEKTESPDCLQSTLVSENCSIDGLPAHTNIIMTETLADKPYEGQWSVADQWQKRIADLQEDKFTLDSDQDQCEVHKMQQEYYCSDCNTVACIECITDVHALHQCDMISMILAGTMSQLRSSVQPACECMSRADTSLQQLAQDHESIESNRDLCKESITTLFNKIRTTVDEREQLLLSTLDSYIDQKLYQVEKQNKNLNRIKDEIHQCLEDIHKALDSTSAAVLINKQQLIDDIDVQDQSILDIENCLKRSMFSSTYIGFRDNSTSFQEKLDKLIVMCEYYPDADSGYYTSRVISLEVEENLYAETKPQDMLDLSEIVSNTSSDRKHSISSIDERCDDHNSEHGLMFLQRSFSTPSITVRPKWLTRKRRSDACATGNGPLIPIRYDSLQMPALIKKPLSVFDKLSTSKKEVVHPCGVCVGENNSIITTDVRNHRLRIISSNGRCIGDIGREGKGSGQFEDPCAVAVNEKMQIFVCQRENPRIQKLTSAGRYMKKLGPKSLRGNNLGEPWALVVAPDGKLYVSDWDKNCIHVFNSTGDYHLCIGGDDSLLGEYLKFPAGIAMNADGQLIVADRGNHCLWMLETNGHILRRIASRGHRAGELYFPYGVAVHKNGSIIVSESGNNRISIFSPCGKFVNHFGQRGSEPGMFEHPRHVCITHKGELIVADEVNHRLQLFEI